MIGYGGCGEGNCGACTILVDGRAVQSRDTPLRSAPGQEITTIEGLGEPASLHPIQQAFLDGQAAQCGYCSNGIMLAAILLIVLLGVLGNWTFLSTAGATLAAVAAGLGISFVTSTITGVLMGRVMPVEHGLRCYVNSLFATPMVAIMPLLTLWFGYDADARLAAGRALVAAVVAEFFISISGLGYFILYNSRTSKHNEAFVAVIVLVAAGVSFDALTRWLTRRYSRGTERTRVSDATGPQSSAAGNRPRQLGAGARAPCPDENADGIEPSANH